MKHKHNDLSPLFECQESAFFESVGVSGNAISGVKLLARESKNNRSYEERALKESLPMFEGLKVFANHIFKPDEHRDFRDLMGKITAPYYQEGAVFGTLELLESFPGVAQLRELAEKRFPGVGMSITGKGKTRRQNGKDIVEQITHLHSVDVVIDAATTLSLFESTTPNADEDAFNSFDERKVTEMTFDELTEASLREQRADLIEKVTATATAPLLQQVKDLTEQLTTLTTQVQKTEREALVATVLSESKALKPLLEKDKAQATRVRERLMACKDETAMRQDVALLESLCASGPSAPIREQAEGKDITQGSKPIPDGEFYARS